MKIGWFYSRTSWQILTMGQKKWGLLYRFGNFFELILVDACMLHWLSAGVHKPIWRWWRSEEQIAPVQGIALLENSSCTETYNERIHYPIIIRDLSICNCKKNLNTNFNFQTYVRLVTPERKQQIRWTLECQFPRIVQPESSASEQHIIKGRHNFCIHQPCQCKEMAI